MTSTLLKLLPKVRRRIPAFLGQSQWLDSFEDKLSTKSFLVSHDIKQLKAAQRQCRLPEDFFHFAGKIFPSHQIRTEITGFLEFAAQHNPRAVAEIGTAQGGTNFLLGQALTSTELIVAIDLFVRNTPLLREFNSRNIEQIFVNGSSYSSATVEHVDDPLSGRRLDLPFIDGDHIPARA